MLKNLFKNSSTNEEDEEIQLIPEDEDSITYYTDNRKWVFDMEKLEEICFKTKTEIGQATTEITEAYEKSGFGENLSPATKAIREIKTTGNTQNDTMRYDLMKMFLGVLLGKDGYMFGNLDEELKYSLALNISFNTLKKYGILKEVKK